MSKSRRRATGLRIWGTASRSTVHRKFTLAIDGKDIATELFRRANKALTVTGLSFEQASSANIEIDRLIDWAVTWGERRKAEMPAAPTRATASTVQRRLRLQRRRDRADRARAARRREPIAATCSTPLSAIISASAGTAIASLNTSAHFPNGIGGATS